MLSEVKYSSLLLSYNNGSEIQFTSVSSYVKEVKWWQRADGLINGSQSRMNSERGSATQTSSSFSQKRP